MFTHREDPRQFLFLLLGKAAMITTPEPFGSHALVSVFLRNQRSVSSSPGSRKAEVEPFLLLRQLGGKRAGKSRASSDFTSPGLLQDGISG